jgi:uncharacterized iron-regulated membrane protein
MPTVFHLHRYLLSGDTGKTITGVTGMMLFISVLLGVVLWWPKFKWRSLKQSVRITHGGSWSRFIYTSHRAGGIFVAPVLATIAFSGWYLNLPKWVTPIIASVATLSPQPSRSGSAAAGHACHHAGSGDDSRAASSSRTRQVTRISLPRKPGDAYEVRLRQEGEVRADTGATRLWLDAYTGRPLAVRDPRNAASGDTIINWLFPLHTGEAFGSWGARSSPCSVWCRWHSR